MFSNNQINEDGIYEEDIYLDEYDCDRLDEDTWYECLNCGWTGYNSDVCPNCGSYDIDEVLI